MMRVVGRIGLMATAIAAIAATSAFATNPRMGVPSMTAIPGTESVGPRTFNGTGFEQAEGYNVGTLSNVNGWRCGGSANPTPPGPRCSTGVVAKGNGSNQGLLLDQNFNFPNSTFIGPFTPKFKDFHASTLNVDIRVDDLEGGSYYLIPQSPTQALVTSYFVLDWTGTTLVTDDIGAGFQFVDTGYFFPLDEWFTVQMDFDYANLAITYSVGPDKDHLTPIYTSGMPAATQVDELVIFSDNYQNTGLGSLSGGPVGAYIDNIVSKPEPGTLAMLGIGALLALRRRSR